MEKVVLIEIEMLWLCYGTKMKGRQMQAIRAQDEKEGTFQVSTFVVV